MHISFVYFTLTNMHNQNKHIHKANTCMLGFHYSDVGYSDSTQTVLRRCVWGIWMRHFIKFGQKYAYKPWGPT